MLSFDYNEISPPPRRLAEPYSTPDESRVTLDCCQQPVRPLSTGGFSAEFTVEDYLGGKRIDSFLNRHLRNYTRFRLQRMIHADLATVNGVVADLKQRVYRGQRVAIRLVEPPDKLLAPHPRPVKLLYEDPWIIVVDKPAGQIVHPVGEYQTDTLANALQARLDRQAPLPGLLRPGFVHRLDLDTSGVIVVTKEHLSHRRLSIQFQNGTVDKSYVALVEGVIEPDDGTIRRPIGQIPGGNCVLMSAQPGARSPRPARTVFRVVERFAAFTLIQARLFTGRLHQIRVHLATIGHPVVDDEFYGPFGIIKRTREESDRRQAERRTGRGRPGTLVEGMLVGRQALHAHQIAFDHPITGQRMSCLAPLPDDLRTAIDRLRGGKLSTAGAVGESTPGH